MRFPTAEAVRTHLAQLQEADSWNPPAAYGLGLAAVQGDKVLDTAFVSVNLGVNLGFAALIADIVGSASGTVVLTEAQIDAALETLAPIVSEGGDHPNVDGLEVLKSTFGAGPSGLGVRRIPVVTRLASLDDAPADVHDVYLRLHLLSLRLVQPHGLNLDGQFGILPNVVWTNHGPADPDHFDLARARLLAQGASVEVYGVDKFPRMTEYVVPSGVRIANADRVRLGAHLAEGTTVMHEGFVNFNAGTLGAAMVEGRISAGVVVDDHTDIGGGASIMGTLSGGGKEVIRLGKRCLLGANAGIGISLGDDCTVEAGLYVTAGTLVTLPDGSVVKARELSGQPGLLFRRNSRTGAVEALAASGSWGGLNSQLHSND